MNASSTAASSSFTLDVPLLSASSSEQHKTNYFMCSLVHTTNKADPTCLFWYIKPDPHIWPQQQTPASPQSRASHLRFISYFHLIGGCFGVITLWQWALCCGWAVYIALLETCWHWDEELSCSQGLDSIWIWIVVGKDRSASARNGGRKRLEKGWKERGNESVKWKESTLNQVK